MCATAFPKCRELSVTCVLTPFTIAKTIHHTTFQTPKRMSWAPPLSGQQEENLKYCIQMMVEEREDGSTDERDGYIVCNANVNAGGDCHGSSFCDDYQCDHCLYRCKCEHAFCGCCFELQHKFTICPNCNTEAVKTAMTMRAFRRLSPLPPAKKAADDADVSDGVAMSEGA